VITVSDTLRALMVSGQYQRADLYTLNLVNGAALYWTSWQVAIVSGGHTFTPVMRIGGDRKWKIARGLEASTFSVTVGVDPENEPAINGVPFRQAARAGLLSGAQLQMDWAYLSGGALVGVLPRFSGTVGQVMPDRLGAKLAVNSPLKVLDMQIPAKLYGPALPLDPGRRGLRSRSGKFRRNRRGRIGGDPIHHTLHSDQPVGLFRARDRHSHQRAECRSQTAGA
jgi:hypothetical protein